MEIKPIFKSKDYLTNENDRINYHKIINRDVSVSHWKDGRVRYSRIDREGRYHFTKLHGYETFARHRTCRHVTRDSHGTPEITGTL